MPAVKLVIFGAMLATVAAAQASTPAAYAALDARSAKACIAAAGLNRAKVGPVIRFSDTTGMDARVVTGTWKPRHMKGAAATMLCLYDRRSRTAETQEMAR